MEGRLLLTSDVLPLLVFILVHTLIAFGNPLEEKSDSLLLTTSTAVGDSSPTSPTMLSQQTTISTSYNTTITATNSSLGSTSSYITTSSELPRMTSPIPIVKSNDSSNLTHGDGSLKAEKKALFPKTISTTVPNDVHLPAGNIAGNSRSEEEKSERVNKLGSANTTSRNETQPLPIHPQTDKKSNFEDKGGVTLKPHSEVSTTSPRDKFKTDEPKQVEYNTANRGEGTMILWCANYIALMMLTCMMY